MSPLLLTLPPSSDPAHRNPFTIRLTILNQMFQKASQWTKRWRREPGAPTAGPPDLFHLRSSTYFTQRLQSPSGGGGGSPAGIDCLGSPTRLDVILGWTDNRVVATLRRSHAHGAALKSFLLAINLQIPCRDCQSAVFYFAADGPPSLDLCRPHLPLRYS